jgi:hypothetical protein
MKASTVTSTAKKRPPSTPKPKVADPSRYIVRCALDRATVALGELDDVLTHVDDIDELARGKRLVLAALLDVLHAQRNLAEVTS